MPSQALPVGCYMHNGVVSVINPKNLPVPSGGFYDIRVHPRIKGKDYHDLYYVHELTPYEILKTVEDYQGKGVKMVKHVKEQAQGVKGFLDTLALVNEEIEE